ncbi:MAG: wax ester/triacylglycerol synthase family O-acyltransferase [Halioglobus sp.]
MRLKPLDAIWLLLESAQTPMHVGVLAVFRKPARAGQNYLRGLATTLRDVEPVTPWQMRLADTGLSLLGQRMVEESDFDIDYHFRHAALPAPGGERELGVAVSRLHSQALDRNRPLWEFHLIEGLERNRFAVYFKVHHALVNDVTAVPLVLSLLSDSARARKPTPPWSIPLDLSGTEAPWWPTRTRRCRLLPAPPLRSIPCVARVPA